MRGEPLRDGDGSVQNWYGVFIDIDNQTKARERLRQLEADLAHMNRLSMMGELSASLAHEIKQPIATARNNASAALNFLDKQLPDLGEVKEALGCIVGDADRAAAIIDRIRDQIKKVPPQKHRFDLKEAINEVIVLARTAIAKNVILVDTHLTEGALSVEGDRVQLQQVLLNLILNAVEALGSVEAGARELLISTSLARPNGNTTGLSIFAGELDGKRQEILVEAVRGLRRMAALADANTTPVAKLDALREAARARNIELSIYRIAGGGEIAAAIDMAQASGAAALNVLASPMLFGNRQLIMDRVAALRLPAIYQWPDTAEEGGFVAYGLRFAKLYEFLAQQAVKLFRGIKVADIPVEQPTKFELAINLKTAKALGLTIPNHSCSAPTR